MTDFGYPIRAAARMTGISVDSIRAWERRYSAIKPKREKGGRLYSESDIIRLKLLKRAVDHGHSIGQIAGLDNQNLERLPLRKHGDVTDVPGVERSDSLKEIRAVMAFIDEYDAINADRVVGKLASLLTPREFVHGAVIPLMNHVGEAWREGRLSVAKEHMISSIMRNILGTLVRLHAKESNKIKILFATPPNELHEFGILVSGMLTVAGGLSLVYLGPNLPESEVVRAAKKTKPKAVVMSIVADGNVERERTTSLVKIRQQLPDAIEMVVGGKISQHMHQTLADHKIIHLQSFEHYENYIQRFGAKF